MEPEKEKKKYLLVNDVLYDVTGFVKKHPGGSVLQTMLWNEDTSKDASFHFREFHYRQNQSPTSQVKELLSTMPKAPPELQAKAKKSCAKTPRDADMMKDFVKLRQDLEKKGFFEPCSFWLGVRIVALAFGWILGYYLLACNWYFSGLLVLICSFQQSGWFQHEGGHRSLTTNVTLDKVLQCFVLWILYGGSADFWNYQHNNHHANTQNEEYDTDVKTLPLLAFDATMLPDEKGKKGKKRKSFWIKHQWLTYFGSNFMVVPLWRYFLHLRYEYRKNTLVQYISFPIFCCEVWHCTILHKFCGFDWKWTMITHSIYLVCGMCLLLHHFTVSHTFTGTHKGKYNWVEMASFHTVNIKDHWFVNILMGLLNFQIEHHLFPQMSHINARRAAPYVKELFKKYDLPYYEYGYFEGFFLVFKNLYHVGHDLSPVRPIGVDLNKQKTQ